MLDFLKKSNLLVKQKSNFILSLINVLKQKDVEVRTPLRSRKCSENSIKKIFEYLNLEINSLPIQSMLNEFNCSSTTNKPLINFLENILEVYFNF